MRAMIVISLVLATLGCESYTKYQRRHQLELLDKKVDAKLKDMQLVTLTHGATDDEEQRIRILITPDAVTVDNAPWLAGFDDEQLAAVDKATGGKHVVWHEGLQPTEAAVSEALGDAVEIAEMVIEDFDGLEAWVYVDARVPLKTLTTVLEAAGDREITGLRYGVDTKDGPRFVAAAPPGACAAPDPEREVLYCAVPEVQVTDKGLMVRARRRLYGFAGCDVPPPAGSDHKQQWDGRVMLGSWKGCPSIMMDDGEHDLRKLTRLLRDVAAITPVCKAAVVSAPEGSSWADVAVAVLGVSAHSTYSEVSLAARSAGPMDCTQGIEPAALPGVAEKLAKNEKAVKRLSIMGILDEP